MKNYKVRALFGFNDTAEKTASGVDTPRAKGDVWNCTKDRYEFLKDHNAVELVGIDEIKEPEVFIGYTQVVAPTVAKKVGKSRKTKLTSKK